MSEQWFCEPTTDGTSPLEQIENWTSEGISEAESINRIKSMLQIDQVTIPDALIEEVVQRVIQRIKPTIVQINVINSTLINSPITVNVGAADKKKPLTKMSLPFRLLKDPRLSFTDRIIFSFLWKWAYTNRKRRIHVSNQNLRRATGFRRATINSSIAKLQDHGYLSDDWKPLVTKGADKTYTLHNGVPYLGFRRCEFENGGDIKGMIATCIHMSNKPRQNRIVWFMQSLGISRTSAWRLLRTEPVSVGTVETQVGTVETVGGNG